jgi:hypothetical protein
MRRAVRVPGGDDRLQDEGHVTSPCRGRWRAGYGRPP